MRKLTFTFFVMVVFGLAVFAQDTESYTALKVTGDNIPVIDGTIDAIWDNVEIVPLEKVPEQGGVVHANITEPNPDPTDYYAEFGMLWNEDGMYFLFTVVDDALVIFEDYNTGNSTPADKWWVDDNINLLFSKDLINSPFTQWEFAWQPGIDQEEKLSSSDWENPALIDISLVSSAWYQDGNTYTLETFIDWLAFDDGNADISENMDIFLEARARDDDDMVVDDPWETMFQWSTVNYNIETDGIGFGTVTLSAMEVVAPTAVKSFTNNTFNALLAPSYSTGNTQLQLTLDKSGDVYVAVYDMTGKKVKGFVLDNRIAGKNSIPLDLNFLQQGIYMVNVQSGINSSVLKYIKQ